MTKTRLLALLLVLVMALSVLASCKKDKKDDDITYTDPYAQYTDYDEKSQKIYDDILGDFYTAYEAAKKETNVSKRYALMAIAEAKLMEAAVMLPIYSNGGNYAISRVAPNTVPFALWGNDSYRYHNALVVTDPIKSADRDVMKAKWAELKGDDAQYAVWAETFLKDKGYTLKDEYKLIYTADPSNWDVLASSKAVDAEALVNTYDGLMEYDEEGNLRPALAESYTVSADGKTYTFKIRTGAIWVNAQGEKVADVKADDFVAGFQHMLDAAGGLENLVRGLIVNASEYIDGEVTDFAQVGVKADAANNTVSYTLCAPTSYFLTYLGYGVFAPMSRDYYVSKGGKFGAEYDPAAETYTYAKGPDSIAYCGPYTVTSNTAKNSIVFTKNATYWNKDNIKLNKITWLFDDGEDVLRGYKDMKTGALDGAGLNSSALVEAKKDLVPNTDKTYFDLYGYVSSTDATSFMAFYNVNRAAHANYNDGAIPSPKNATEQTRTIAAMRNVNFRRAISFATDRATYNAQGVGEDLKLNSLRNTYTPGNFVSLTESVTVKINGTDTTYAAGTMYGKIMQDQINADGVKIKVWDPTADGGVGSSDGFDGWYNVDNAKEALNKAIEELADIGIKVSAENPIYIDVPTLTISSTWNNKENAYKQSIETALEGKVKVNLVACSTQDEWYYAGYDTLTGDQANYDMYDFSGWGPDYGDPQTYLDTFLPAYAGYMTKCIGIF